MVMRDPEFPVEQRNAYGAEHVPEDGYSEEDERKRHEPNPAAEAREHDECMCCDDVFLADQINADGFCMMCAEARRTFELDLIPSGRPCCRRYLSQKRRQMVEAGEIQGGSRPKMR